MEPRVKKRKPVSLYTTLADKTGVITARVTDLSESGCRLSLSKPLTRRQYLALKLYSNDGTEMLQIDLGWVKWTGDRTAGIEFITLSPTDTIRLARMCGDSDDLAVA